MIRTKLGAFIELVRLRIAVLVLFATGTGYVLALRFEDGAVSVVVLIHALLGTAMVAAGSNTLNQVIVIQTGAGSNTARLDDGAL